MGDKDIVDITGNKSPYLGSIIFLVFVIILTASLFYYNYYLEKETVVLKNEIKTYDEKIAIAEKDKSFKVYALIDGNKKIIEKITERSKISKYIEHLKKIEKDYTVEFNGFNLSNGKLDTSITIESDTIVLDDYSLAYKKLVRFIKNYRNDKEALFKLGFITRVTGYNTIKFNLNFEIK